MRRGDMHCDHRQDDVLHRHRAKYLTLTCPSTTHVANDRAAACVGATYTAAADNATCCTASAKCSTLTCPVSTTHVANDGAAACVGATCTTTTDNATRCTARAKC